MLLCDSEDDRREGTPRWESGLDDNPSSDDPVEGGWSSKESREARLSLGGDAGFIAKSLESSGAAGGGDGGEAIVYVLYDMCGAEGGIRYWWWGLATRCYCLL